MEFNITDVFPEEIIQEYIKPYKCPVHGLESQIQGFCEQCSKEEHIQGMIDKTIALKSAEMDEYYHKKYGVNFTIDDFIADSEPKKALKKRMADYIEYIRQRKMQGLHAGHGAILSGNQGNGKTMLGNLLVFEAGKLGYSTKIITMNNLYNSLLEDRRFSEQVIEPQFLMIDEVGRLSETDNVKNQFFDILDRRIRQLKMTVLITNLGEDVYKFFDKDRLKEFAKFIFNWESKRG